MADKVIITRGRKVSGYVPIFISVESHDNVKEAAQEANVSMKELTEAFIEFGLAHLEIVEAEDNK